MSSIKYLIENSRNLEEMFAANGLGRCDLILTSPPYFDTKNYQDARGQIGQRQTYDRFLDDLAKVFDQCYRVSNASATLWVVVDTIRKNGALVPLPFDLNDRIRKTPGCAGWTLRDVLIWDKYKNVPWHNKGRFKNRFEYILFYSKKGNYKYHVDRIRQVTDYKKWWLTYPERYNLNGSPPANIWQYTTPIRGWGNARQNHFCPFPFPLIERILTLCSDEGDIVLDPFAGSGSVLAIAEAMNRDAIGIDINEEYRDKFYQEVVVGAQKYWQTRSREIKEIRANITKFSTINLQLRKIKACVTLAKEIRDVVGRDARFVALDKAGVSSKEIKFCVIVPRARACQHKLANADIPLPDVSREFKVDIELSTLTGASFAAGFPQTGQLYGYSEDRIYRYNAVVSVPNLLNGTLPCDRLYSNIKLRLNRSLTSSPMP